MNQFNKLINSVKTKFKIKRKLNEFTEKGMNVLKASK